MGHVREIGAPRFDELNVAERLLKPEMCRVLLEAQTVEHQQIKTLQRLNRGRRNLAQIRGVGKIVEAVSDHRQPSMDHFQWRHGQISADTKWRTSKDRVRYHQRQPAAKVCWFEDVFEDAPDVWPCPLVGINSHCTIAKIQRPNVVQAKDVIGMTVSYQHC